MKSVLGQVVSGEYILNRQEQGYSNMLIGDNLTMIVVMIPGRLCHDGIVPWCLTMGAAVVR